VSETYSDRFIDGIKWRCYYSALLTYVLVWMLFYFMNCQFFKRSNHEPAFFTFPLVCICFLTTWISITILTFKLFCFVIKDSTMVIDSVLQLNYLGHLITYNMSDVISVLIKNLWWIRISPCRIPSKNQRIDWQWNNELKMPASEYSC